MKCRGRQQLTPAIPHPACSPPPPQVFFHGCARAARAFWPFDPVQCPECMGALLPCHHCCCRCLPLLPLPAAGIAHFPCSAAHRPPSPLRAGFPEHVSHTKQALAAGYNVVVMDPSDTRHLCWSSTNNDGWSNDQPRVIGTLMQLLQRRGLNSKPVYLWGASSGGTLALKMPLWLAKYRAWAAQQAAAGVQVPPLFSVAGVISGGWVHGWVLWQRGAR